MGDGEGLVPNTGELEESKAPREMYQLSPWGGASTLIYYLMPECYDARFYK